jgi:outer membrane protein TolC
MILKWMNSFIGNCLIRPFITTLILLFAVPVAFAQQTGDQRDTMQYLTLKQCIQYALTHEPELNKSLINIDITKTTNDISLSGWLPQVALSGNYTHYIEQPTTFINNTSNPSAPPTKEKQGVINNFTPEVYVSQAIFSPALLYAYKSAPLYVKQAQQITDSTKINVVASVTKAFYNLLLTLEQINVLKADTVTLGQTITDTYHQYIGGIVDETDYDQAIITMNNVKAQLKQANENVRPQYATLKQLMGLPPAQQFNVNFDTLEMMNDIYFDTTQQLQYDNRIELQLLQTNSGLQHQETRYYQNSYLPSVSAFYEQNLVFENNTFGNLFSGLFPNSLFGASLTMPIFTGFARIKSIHRSQLQERLINWNETEERSQIYSEYTAALATYKGNLYNLETLQQNVNLANKVYFIINLQYKQGLVAYLNLVTAESNLITAQINYTNALFQVLSSKVDLQKAMGIISY